ncbi:MAG: lipocalin-like domain-containing protein [Verrucomicrobiota bacterium]
MIRVLVTVLYCFCVGPEGRAQEPSSSWKRAEEGWDYQFPRDEFPHPDFKTEWWYFTGNVVSEENPEKRFGYQLTFFRQGLRPPDDRSQTTSRWVPDHLWFAHFALSDLTGRDFHHAAKTSRGSFGECPPKDHHVEGPKSIVGHPLVWIEDWSLTPVKEDLGHYRLLAKTPDFGIELLLHTEKPPVFHGADGISPKAREPGHASHYYSLTRLATSGNVWFRKAKTTYAVKGNSWYDREWSTSLLAQHQVGWDWISLHMDQGEELMLFQLREEDGSPNFSSGTVVRADGTFQPLHAEDVRLVPLRFWNVPGKNHQYPIAWKAVIQSPDLRANLELGSPLANQRLDFDPISYWEGSIQAEGTWNGMPAEGVGYLEMTGYEGALPGLRLP